MLLDSLELYAGRFCCDCDLFLAWDEFKVLRHGLNGHHSRCRNCDTYNSRLLTRLRKTTPRPKDNLCEICHAAPYRELHHDHSTNLAIAWACKSCNRKDRARWVLSYH